ncbi:hypothetical protein MCEZE10_02134 [Sphingomonadaceae bacterium]
MINHPPYSHGLKSLEKLHADLATADKKWLDASTTARSVSLLIARLNKFWCDLPRNREPVLQAFERTGFLMKVIIAACANDTQMEHSFATRNLVRDTLDELCITIDNYRAGFNDD